MAGSEWKEIELSSGVRVRYGPFPGSLYWDIMARALEQYPDPEPPKKRVEVVDGFEEVEDTENPDYKAALAKARLARAGVLGEAVLELCVEPVGDWESIVQRLEKKWAKDVPTDPTDRKVWFLSKYALRTPEDWQIISLVQRFSQIQDEEVARRAEFFRGDVAGPESPGTDAPGPGAG